MTAAPLVATPFAATPHTPAGHLALHFLAASRLLKGYVATLGSGNDLNGVSRFLETYTRQAQFQPPESTHPAHERLWWARALREWEKGVEAPLPLCALERTYALDFDTRLAFVTAGIVEEDSRFGTLFAELQTPIHGRRPTLETLGRIFTMNARAETGDPWVLCRPLIQGGLLEAMDGESPRAEQSLRVPRQVWDAVRGEPPRHPWPAARYRPRPECPDFVDLVYPATFQEQLERIPAMMSEGRARILVIRHGEGADFEEIAGAIARRLGCGLLLLEAGTDAAPTPASVGPLCSAAQSLPLFVFQLKPGEAALLPRLPGYSGPMLAAVGLDGGLRLDRRESAVSIHVPFPDRQSRERRWLQALGGKPVEKLPEIRDRFQLEGGHIQRLADAARLHAAVSGRAAIRPEDVRAAGCLLNRQALERLARPVTALGKWSDLVAAPGTVQGLADLERRCRRREELVEQFGTRFGSRLNRGVRSLLIGSSGTGKTMAAGILASELGGMELYRVDLASVVNKYIGETESNLHEVLTRAEALDVILLIDEGDALMGRRTEVKSSNDRYANLETNFLLQRLETYQGIVIVTTNLSENIDPAFQRRMDIVVQFHPPEADGRRRIFDLHLPAGHAVEESYLNLVSRRCNITGGQIRNAVLHAAAKALDQNSPIRAWHLQEAVEREYQKAGATFPLASYDLSVRAPDGGFADFVSALNGRKG